MTATATSGGKTPGRPLRETVEAPSALFGHYGALTLTMAPWVPPDTVLRAYRRRQRELLGGDNRSPSARNLAVLRFITKQRARGDQRPKWRELLQRWNRAYPQWRYDDVRRFARDYSRTQQVLAPRLPQTAAPNKDGRPVANVAKRAKAGDSRGL